MHAAARPSDLVGNTPLLGLSSLLEGAASGSKLYGRLESLGPCSSDKGRIGKYMIDNAEAQGLITPVKATLVEPLAFIARERGYRCILTLPETMSVERRMMLLVLGANVILTP
jgi:cysteine synthase